MVVARELFMWTCHVDVVHTRIIQAHLLTTREVWLSSLRVVSRSTWVREFFVHCISRVHVDVRVRELALLGIRDVCRHRPDPVRSDTSRARARAPSSRWDLCSTPSFLVRVIHEFCTSSWCSVSQSCLLCELLLEVLSTWKVSRREAVILYGTSCALVVSYIRIVSRLCSHRIRTLLLNSNFDLFSSSSSRSLTVSWILWLFRIAYFSSFSLIDALIFHRMLSVFCIFSFLIRIRNDFSTSDVARVDAFSIVPSDSYSLMIARPFASWLSSGLSSWLTADIDTYWRRTFVISLIRMFYEQVSTYFWEDVQEVFLTWSKEQENFMIFLLYTALIVIQGSLVPEERLMTFLDDLYVVTPIDCGMCMGQHNKNCGRILPFVSRETRPRCGIRAECGRILQHFGADRPSDRSRGPCLERIRITNRTMVHPRVGTPLRHEDFVAAHLQDSLRSHQTLLDRIPKLGTPPPLRISLLKLYAPCCQTGVGWSPCRRPRCRFVGMFVQAPQRERRLCRGEGDCQHPARWAV